MRSAGKVPAGDEWRLEADPADPDTQTLLFHYPSAFDSEDYVPPVVKIELGARSDTDPVEMPQIEPYLAETFPELLGPSRFTVRAVAARRTFWEKAMLLHEESYRPAGKGRSARLSRHYYDLWCLISRGIAEQALADAGLFERIATHRAVFFRYNWMDYATLRPGVLRLLPLEEQRAAWAQDYAAMRETMIFGEAPDFDEILRVVGEFEKVFNMATPSVS